MAVMKLFGMIILAGIVSALVGGGVTLLESILIACRTPAGCGFSEVHRVILVPIYMVLGMAVFAVAATRPQWSKAMFYALRLLVLIPVLLVVVGLAADAAPGAKTKQMDILNALQLAVPFWVVIVVQYRVIRRYLASSSRAHAGS